MKLLIKSFSLLFTLPHNVYTYHFNSRYLISPIIQTVTESPFIRFILLDTIYPKTLKNFISSYQMKRIKKQMELKEALLYQKISLFNKSYLVIFPKEKQALLPSLSHSKKSHIIFWPFILLSLLKYLLPHPLFSDKDSFLFFVYGKNCGLRQFVFLENTLILSRFHEPHEFSSFEKIKDRLHETRLYIERISHKPFHTLPIISLMEEDTFSNHSFENISSFSIFPKIALAQLLGFSESSQNSIEFLILSAFIQKRASYRNKAHIQKSPIDRQNQTFYGTSIFLLIASLILGWHSYEIRKKETLHTEFLLQTLSALKEKTLHLGPSSLDFRLVEQAKVLAKTQKTLYLLQQEPFSLFTKMGALLGNEWEIESISWKLSEDLPFKLSVSMKITPSFSTFPLEQAIEKIEALKDSFLIAFSDPIFSSSFSLVEDTHSEPQETFLLSLVVGKDIPS